MTPAAAGLRRQGATKGATASFLIATPETGADSIAVTYALLDAPMTVLRPLAAVITAIAAGLGVRLTEGKAIPAPPQLAPMTDVKKEHGCATRGCCEECCAPQSPSFGKKIRAGLEFCWRELLPDIGGSFLLGVVLAGAVTAVLPDAFLEQHLGRGIVPMLMALVVSLPLYVCATSGTPIAAALALKGLSPGAALVFLLAGPATNLAAVTVVLSILGRAGTAIYLGAVIVCSLGVGLAVDWLYTSMNWTTAGWTAGEAGEVTAWVQTSAAVLLLAATAYTWTRKKLVG